MKILYVTYLWKALSDVLYEGDTEIRGMPAFFKVLQALLEQGNEVDVILYDTGGTCKNSSVISPQIEWLKSIRFVVISNQTYSGLKKPIGELRGFIAVKRATKKLIKENQYNFIYGHGPISEAANVAAKGKIPFGERRYGDSLYFAIQKKGLLYMILSQTLNIYSYRKKKSFMIATNDGSRVDLVYKMLNPRKPPYPLYYWLNGVDKISKETGKILEGIPEGNYLLFAARIVNSKRQHLAVELMSILRKRGLSVQLFLAGSMDDEEYFNKLMESADKLNVGGQVHYLGNLTRRELLAYGKDSVACLSFYESCNLGNVFIENFSSGCVTISLNDGSLDDIVTDRENGFLVSDMDEAADVVEELLSSPQLRNMIKRNAERDSSKIFLSWKDRTEKEILLIKHYKR